MSESSVALTAWGRTTVIRFNQPAPLIDDLLAGKYPKFFTECGPCDAFLSFLREGTERYLGSGSYRPPRG